MENEKLQQRIQELENKMQTLEANYQNLLNPSAMPIEIDNSIQSRGFLKGDIVVDPTVVTGTVTVSIASPAVFTATNHGLYENWEVYFTTTGALPTGITELTTYYVIASGLTVDTFKVSDTLGGSAINTSGSQSGIHTFSTPNSQMGTPIRWVRLTNLPYTSPQLYLPIYIVSEL